MLHHQLGRHRHRRRADVTRIYNANTAEAWSYVQGSGWIKLSATVQQELGFVREVTNPETGYTYLIEQDSITLQ